MSAPGGSPTADVLMDSVYRRQRHIYDVTRKYFLLGRDTLIARAEPAARRQRCWRSAAAPGGT